MNKHITYPTENVSNFCKHIINTRLESDYENGFGNVLHSVYYGYNMYTVIDFKSLVIVIKEILYKNLGNNSFDIINDLILPYLFKVKMVEFIESKMKFCVNNNIFIGKVFINPNIREHNRLICKDFNLNVDNIQIDRFVKSSLYQHNILWGNSNYDYDNSSPNYQSAANGGSFKNCRFISYINNISYDFINILKEFIIAMAFNNIRYIKSFISYAFLLQKKEEPKYVDYGYKFVIFKMFFVDLMRLVREENINIVESIFMAVIQTNSLELFKYFELIKIFRTKFNAKMLSKAIQVLVWIYYDKCSKNKDLLKYLINKYPSYVKSIYCVRNKYNQHMVIDYLEPNALYYAILREDMEIIKMICENVENLIPEYFLNENNCLQLAISLNNLEIFKYISEFLLKNYFTSPNYRFCIKFDNNLDQKWNLSEKGVITNIGNHENSLISIIINTKNRIEFYKYVEEECSHNYKKNLFYKYDYKLKKYLINDSFEFPIQAALLNNYEIYNYCVYKNYLELYKPCYENRTSMTLFEKILLSFDLEKIKSVHNEFKIIGKKYSITDNNICSYNLGFGFLHHLLYYYKNYLNNHVKLKIINVDSVKEIINWLWLNYSEHFYQKDNYVFRSKEPVKNITINRTPIQIYSIFKRDKKNPEKLIEYYKHGVDGELDKIRDLINELMNSNLPASKKRKLN